MIRLPPGGPLESGTADSASGVEGQLATGTVVIAGCLAGTASSQSLPGGLASPDIEFVGNIPDQAGTLGGRVRDGYFYVTTARGVTIYDISEPASPRRTGGLTWPKPGDPYSPEEDPDTNGRILLVENLQTLYVIDVRDKSAPRVMGTLDGIGQHTLTCVLDCTWAFGSEGAIGRLARSRASAPGRRLA